jgi:hypothetical protein
VLEEFTPITNIDAKAEREKPRLVSLLFCDYANKTAEGKFNLLGTFDAMQLDPSRPTKATPHFIVFIRIRNITDGLLQLAIYGPDNKLAAAVGTQVKHEAAVRHLRALIRVQFVVQEPGTYWVDVTHEGVSLGGDSLDIRFETPEATEG